MKSRRFGRQIPADMAILSVFSLSLLLGLPVARRLHLLHSGGNKFGFLWVGFAVGFLILVSVYKAFDFTITLYRRKKRDQEEDK